ncbi:response regulator [Kibdelosporangium aridum]|uniref:DNA-binding response regulator, NarL/FixJ family, contains REC and HTH domains n=1 Tax=Kibdelosporangium aridum TaxID=2030 RepID=A0A1W1ZLQ8_KIBAR|nr:response regulator transcription factor [Kibdelosporangium aridum]SMC49369.1 DNA-binding response regulator, NarL/FixJ family, contains REC and HTH domains [Kibdelosporangium aridum]
MTVRVLVVDDYGAIRAGLAMILNDAEGIQVVGEAADGATAISQAKALRPDVVLMDLRMPGVDGITATRAIVGDGLAQVLVLTSFDLDKDVYNALRAGASGYMLKSVEAPKLVEAVRLVASGEGVLSPVITRKLIDTFAATAPPTTPTVSLEELTTREREVFACLSEGLSNAQIASRLLIAETTVKTHVSKVLGKLGLRSRVQAAIVAQESS